MICNRLFFSFLLFLIGPIIINVSGENVPKGSLVFVIDKTNSMKNVIKDVLNNSRSIFETVSNFNESTIENFVLVHFGDPNVSNALVTKDQEELKEALDSILHRLEDGGDCPELSMTGLKTALESSLNGSFIYVFTDAAAKDNKLFDSVKRLAQEKDCQLVFILIKGGRCELSDPEDVYSKLANATSGQVFYMYQQDISTILSYVKESIKNRKPMIHAREYPPGMHKYELAVDCRSRNVVMSLTGTKPDSDGELVLYVTAPPEIETYVDKLVERKEILIKTMEDAEPGIYNVTFGNKKSSSYIVIRARTDITFHHGFSRSLVSSLNDTVVMPIAGVKNYLYIKLFGENVRLTSVQLHNESYDILQEKRLELFDEKQKVYVTKPFNLPRKPFRIVVIGTDEKCPKIPIVRFGNMVLETGTFLNKNPTITIKNGSKVIVDHNARLELDCLVDAFPEPDIIWRNSVDGMEVPSTLFIHSPNNYSRILELEHAMKNETYECYATNTLGIDRKSIKVEVKPEPSFYITEEPKNQELNYDQQAVLNCKVNAYPPAQIFWLPQPKTNILKKLNKLTISPDNSTLTINHMREWEVGMYTCVIKHLKSRYYKHATLTLSTRRPKIYKEPSDLNISVNESSSVTIPCSLIDGVPQPEIKWYRKLIFDPSAKFIEMKEARNQTHVILENRNRFDTGTYKCEARNFMGNDVRYIQLSVECRPEIQDDDARIIEAKLFSEVNIKCEVQGIPFPEVSWYKDDKLLETDEDIIVYGNNNLRLEKVDRHDAGSYKCKAANKLGQAEKITDLIVYDLRLEPPEETNVSIELNHELKLACKAEGFPEPIQYNWLFYSHDTETITNISSTYLSLDGYLTRSFKAGCQGQYTCVASTTGISKNITYVVEIGSQPTIQDDDIRTKVAKLNSEVNINCTVQGKPTPNVLWYKDKQLLEEEEDNNVIIYKNHTLRLKKVQKNDTGTFTCKAFNKLGNDVKLTTLIVYDLELVNPEETNVLMKRGKKLKLHCNAKGFPEPIHYEWLFYSYKTNEKTNFRARKDGTLIRRHFKRDQQGRYTCVANTTGIYKNITYYVDIATSPKIADIPNYRVIEGDRCLEIICNATGAPKPTIVWWKDGAPVAYDSNKLAEGNGFWFGDNWLKIWNISSEAHSYHCAANNSEETVISNPFTVNVDKYPPPELIENDTIMYVEIGSKSLIKCYIPHERIDWLVWYKDNKVLHWGELELNNVKMSDEGVYTCRVTNNSLPNEIRTATTSVRVGMKPNFLSELPKNVVLKSKQSGYLNCLVSDGFTPTITWRHNGEIMVYSGMVYTFIMNTKTVGEYTCDVTNTFGSIKRTFDVTYEVGACTFKIDSDAKNEPLMLTTSGTWPSFKTYRSNTIIPANETLALHCPKKFKNFDTNYLIATCIGETIFRIDRTYQDYTDIECNEEVLPKVKHTSKAKKKCLGNDTSYKRLIFDIGYRDIEAYEYCLDRESNPIYVKYIMRAPSDYTPEDTTMWDRTDLDSYSCSYQARRFVKIRLDTRRCCFAARHLVNPRDVFPGPLQRASFNCLNIVPHWSTCRHENWDEVEKRVRDLSTSLDTNLIIYTGTAGYWTSPLHGKNTVMTLKPNFNIAAYLWKVVQHPETKSSIAIIQLNIPQISFLEVLSNHIVCPDICHELAWLRSLSWHNINKGFTYCCELEEFIRRFQEKDIDRDFMNWNVFEPYYSRLDINSR